jgi:hypothetical protein
MSADTAFMATLTTFTLLLYFLALDTLAGASVLAANAWLRGTPPHRELLLRLRRLLPPAAVATALLGAAALVLIHATHGPDAASALPAGNAERGAIPRLLHVVLAAVAVSGLLVARSALGLEPADAAARAWLARHGALWSMLATLGNMLVGVLWMMRLPHETMIRFTGADTAAMLTFSIAIVAGILALGFTAMSLTVRDPRRYLDAAVVTLFVTLLAMVRMRELLRPRAIDGADLPWGPLALWCALMAVGTWALVLAWRRVGGRQG